MVLERHNGAGCPTHVVTRQHTYSLLCQNRPTQLITADLGPSLNTHVHPSGNLHPTNDIMQTSTPDLNWLPLSIPTPGTTSADEPLLLLKPHALLCHSLMRTRGCLQCIIATQLPHYQSHICTPRTHTAQLAGCCAGFTEPNPRNRTARYTNAHLSQLDTHSEQASTCCCSHTPVYLGA
jgi:hypothetical protein